MAAFTSIHDIPGVTGEEMKAVEELRTKYASFTFGANELPERPGFKANIIFDYTFGSTFGFNKDEEILCSIIDKAMIVIDKETISGQWLRKTFDWKAGSIPRYL